MVIAHDNFHDYIDLIGRERTPLKLTTTQTSTTHSLYSTVSDAITVTTIESAESTTPLHQIEQISNSDAERNYITTDPTREATAKDASTLRAGVSAAGAGASDCSTSGRPETISPERSTSFASTDLPMPDCYRNLPDTFKICLRSPDGSDKTHLKRRFSKVLVATH